MKKNSLVLLILCVLLVCMLSSMFISCNNEKELNLSFDEDTYTLSWNEIKGATSYTIKLNKILGTIIECLVMEEIQETSYDFDAGLFDEDVEYSFVVQAFKNGKDITTAQSLIKKFQDKEFNSTGYWCEENEDTLLKRDFNVEYIGDTIFFDLNTLKSYALKNNTGKKILSISSKNLSSSHYVIDNNKKYIEITKAYVSMFEDGVVEKYEITFEDGSKVSSYFHFTKNVPYKVYSVSNHYKESEPATIDINIKTEEDIKIKKIAVDGKAIASTYYSTSKNIITLTQKYLSLLSNGTHYVEIFTSYGTSSCNIEVLRDSHIPHNVEIDFDSSYPEVYITWKDDESVDGIEVIIDDNVYSNINGDAISRFESNNKFRATGLIRYGSSVQIINLLDQEEYPSVKTYFSLDIDNISYLKYLYYDKGFEYLGEKYNYCITSEEELEIYCNYIICNYDKLKDSEGYVTDSILVTYSQIKSTDLSKTFGLFREALNLSFKSFENSLDIETSGIITYTILNKSTIIPNNEKILYEDTLKYTENAHNDVHYGNKTRKEDYVFNIDKVEKTVEVSTSVELSLALENGVRPIPKQGSQAEIVYNKAKSVLLEIIDDEMNDYEKVHAMYDWLADNVIYDRGMTAELSKYLPGSNEYNTFYSNRSFYAEGALIDGIAVCNGIALAYDILCGIEGIKAYKVNGFTTNNEYHSWIKVYIDGFWYICDATFANVLDGYTECLTHEFLLMDTEKSQPSSKHNEEDLDFKKYYAGDVSYNVWANIEYRVNDKECNCIINSQEEYDALLNCLKNEMKVGDKWLVSVMSENKNVLAFYRNNTAVTGMTVTTGLTQYLLNNITYLWITKNE